MKQGMINYYTLKRYRRWKDAELNELIQARTLIDNGDIDLDKEELMPLTEKLVISDTVENPESCLLWMTDLKIRRMFVEASRDIETRKMINNGKANISFMRTLYSGTNITAKELAYMLGETEGSTKYYIRKYGMVKMPSDATYKIESVEGLRNFLLRPEPVMISTLTNETSEEFRGRYEELGYMLFKKLESEILSTNSESEMVKKLNIAMGTLSTSMKLETEAKGLLSVQKKKEFDFKEKELKGKSFQAPEILEFNGDIEMQQKAMSLSMKLDEMGMNEDQKEQILKEFLGG